MKAEDLRKALQPKGKEQVVRLDLYNNNYFNWEFVERCIKQLEVISQFKFFMKDYSLSPLEKLGVILLLDSAGVDFEKEVKANASEV